MTSVLRMTELKFIWWISVLIIIHNCVLYSLGMSRCAVLPMVEEYIDLTDKTFGKKGHEFLFRAGAHYQS